MRILVCGGRDFSNWRRVLWAMDPFLSVDTVIIQGGAKGADFLGRVWAEYNNIRCEEYPADWKKHGKAAGSIRNQQMLDEGKPDLVVAFPGGTGTADMVRRAKKFGVEVIEVKDEQDTT